MNLTDKNDGPEWLAYGKERLDYDTEELFAFVLFKERNALRAHIAELEEIAASIRAHKDRFVFENLDHAAYQLWKVTRT